MKLLRFPSLLAGCLVVCGAGIAGQSASANRADAERRLILAADASGDGSLEAKELVAFLLERLRPAYVRIEESYRSRGFTPPYRLVRAPGAGVGGAEGANDPSLPSGSGPSGGAAPDGRLTLEDALRQYVDGMPLSVRNLSWSKPVRGAEAAAIAGLSLPVPFYGTIGNLVGVGTEPASIERLSRAPTPSVLDWLDSWVSVRRSFLDARDIARPATFTWTNYGDSDDRSATTDSTRLLVDGAIVIEPDALTLPTIDLGGAWLDWNAVGVFEAHTSTVAAANRARLTHRVGLQGVVASKEYSDLWSAHNIDLTFDYVTDEDYRADVLGWTLQYSPDIHRLGIGRAISFSNDLDVRWRPYVGLTHARVNDRGAAPQFGDFVGYTDLFLRTAVEFKWRDRLRVVPEISYFQELEDEQHGHILAGAAARLSLDDDDRVSFEVSWTRGERSPSRSDVSEVQIALGLKF